MSGIRVDASGIMRGMSDMERKMRAAVGLFGETAALKLEAKAKDEAKWVDRSAKARQTIEGTAKWHGNSMRIGVTGNVDYFEYLEYAMQKRYAILHPTVLELSPEIVEGMRNLLAK